MLKLLVLISLGLALSLPANHPVYSPEDSLITRYYHETIGIAKAARIKTAEEAISYNSSRIVGGSSAAFGQYPHMGGLIIALSGELLPSVCGSSLLSNTKLVTAAHCWWDGKKRALLFTVVLGSNFLYSGGTRRFTKKVEMHGSWNPHLTHLEYDIAIITIDWVDYDNNIGNIALASGSELYVGRWPWAVGFGRQSDYDDDDFITNQMLQHVQVEVISNSECADMFADDIKPTTLCIDGSYGRGTCFGDSGGPLQIVINSEPILIGISSFVYSYGCEEGWPAGFTRVNSFKVWIDDRIEEEQDGGDGDLF